MPFKIKVCPMCGVFQFEEYEFQECRFCRVPYEKTDIRLPTEEEEDDDNDFMVRAAEEEAKYLKENVLPYPEKRAAYLNRKEIQALEKELDDAIREAKHPGLFAEIAAKEAARATANTGVIKCPNCSSTNVERISGFDRGVSVAVLGPFSKKINKSFKCNHCGYTW